MEILSVAKSNLKTTVPGILTFVIAVLGQLIYQFDTDPTTTINWGVLITALLTMLGFGVAKDGPGIKAMGASRKLTMPTTFGIMSFVGLVLTAVKVAFDPDPSTHIDWGTIIVGLLTLFGLTQTSDNGIKSLSDTSDVGIGNPKLYAVLGFLATLVTQLAYMFDNIPATNPDFGIIVSALLAAIGLGLSK